MLVIGTYAPSKNTDDHATESMWQIQNQAMSGMANQEKEQDLMTDDAIHR